MKKATFFYSVMRIFIFYIEDQTNVLLNFFDGSNTRLSVFAIELSFCTRGGIFHFENDEAFGLKQKKGWKLNVVCYFLQRSLS